MIRKLTMTAAALALAALIAGCGGKAKKEEAPKVQLNVNLLTNPSFEEWRGDVPTGWEIQYFDGPGATMNPYGQSTDEKVSGNSAFYMKGAPDVDRWMVLAQRLRVIPGYRLTYSGDIRGQDLAKEPKQYDRSNLFVRFFDRDGKKVRKRYYADTFTRPLRGTSPWQHYERTVDVPENAAFADFGLILQMTGSIYFDDVAAVIEEPIPWKEIEKKYVKYYYLDGNPFPSGAVDKEEALVEKCVKMLGLTVDNKICYYYYPSDQKFQDITGRKSGHERAMWIKQELHTTDSYDNHEIIHMLLVPYGYPPFGICEGAVFYVLGSWENGRNIHMMAKDLILNRQLPALYKLLDKKDMDNLGLATTVPGWASFSIWLIDHFGVEKFMTLYRTTNEDASVAQFNTHFKEVYGKDFEVMDRTWRLWVLRYQPK